MEQHPFKYGTTAVLGAFTNRITETNQLINNFRYGINTILISPRRWGKTSLVEQTLLTIKKRKLNLKTCSIDLFNVKSENEFYEMLSTAVINAASTKIDDAISFTKNFITNLIPKFSFTPNDDQKFTLGFDWNELKEHPDEILDLAEKIAMAKKTRIILCIDEFQNIDNFDNPLAFQKKLRAHWQRHQNVTYCLYGSKRHMMTDIFASAKMPFYKFGEIIMLEKIEGADWEKFIIKRFKQTNKNISRKTARLIHTLTERHSYYVQQLAHQCWLRTNGKCSDDIVYNAFESIAMQLSLLFQNITDGLSAPQTNFLKALIWKETKLSSKEVIQNYRLGTSANITRIKKALQNKEIIDIVNKEISILDPMYKHWLSKYYFKKI